MMEKPEEEMIEVQSLGGPKWVTRQKYEETKALWAEMERQKAETLAKNPEATHGEVFDAQGKLIGEWCTGNYLAGRHG